MKDLVRVGGFWKKTSEKNGKAFLSGQIELSGAKIKLLVFPNGFKERDAQPDFVCYLAETEQAPAAPHEAMDDFTF